MTGLIVVAAIVILAVTVVVLRAIAGRAERRSVDGYERALSTLGDVSRRSEARAPYHVITADDLAQPHVRAQGAVSDPESAPLRSFPAVQPHATGPSPGERLVFVDETGSSESEGPVEEQRARRRWQRLGAKATDEQDDSPAVVVMRFVDDVAPAREPIRKAKRTPHSVPRGTPVLTRTGARAAIVIVVLGGVGIGGWRIAASNGSDHPAAKSNHVGGSNSNHPKPSVTSTTLPRLISPTTSNAVEVDYQVPDGPLHITFVSNGTCWLGIFKGPGSNPSYQWMDTLGTGQTTSVDSTGKTYVRLGNPPSITVSVNGIPLALPSSNVQPYDIVLVPTSA